MSTSDISGEATTACRLLVHTVLDADPIAQKVGEMMKKITSIFVDSHDPQLSADFNPSGCVLRVVVAVAATTVIILC